MVAIHLLTPRGTPPDNRSRSRAHPMTTAAPHASQTAPRATGPLRRRRAALLACGLAAAAGAAAAAPESLQNAVIKLYVAQQREDYGLPWQAGPTLNGTGSGFAISKRRILTNAHVVSNARYLQVKKNTDPRLFRARVVFSAHDCDLAMLAVEDPAFFQGIEPVQFSEQLPKLNDEVVVIGYPLGGTRLSVTRGVVSRIDYSVYQHSGVDQHLVLQADAAINPGNSGGPVLYKGRVVGLAFQGLSFAENIGYAIPFPVIQRFLNDITDSVYDGYPEIGVEPLDLRNPALRDSLGLPPSKTGVAVAYIEPFGCARGRLNLGDVLLAINGHPIAEDATVSLEGNTVHFAELLERKQRGEAVSLSVWRDRAAVTVNVPLSNPPDPFLYRNLYDQRPEYYVRGGLVFCPLTREYLRTLEHDRGDRAVQQLFYYSQYAKRDGLHEGREQFVVLIRRLPHPVNTYTDDYLNGIVESVNGTAIRGLRDVKRAIEGHRGRFHVMRFAGMDDELVLDAAAAAAADAAILARYDVPAPECFEEEP